MPEMIENRMVVDWQWPEMLTEVKKKINGAGYMEIGTGIFVPEEDVFAYALERISRDKDEKEKFLDWFYSGNWVKED